MRQAGSNESLERQKAAPEQQAIRGKPGPKDNDLEISNWRLRTERERRESAVGGGGEGERCPAEYAGGFGCEIPCDCPAWKGCEWAAWNGCDWLGPA